MKKKEESAQIKEPVKVRFRELKNGNTSIYLDCYVNGARKYSFLNLYLRPEKTREDKAWNKEQIRLANAIKSQYIVDIQNGTFGFSDVNKARKIGLVKYVRDIADEYEKNGQIAAARLTRNCADRLDLFRGATVSLAAVDKEYVLAFIEYLKNCTRMPGGIDHKNNVDSKKPLSQYTKISMYNRLCVCLNRAERDGLILRNPCNILDRRDKLKKGESTRCYLTLEELKKIMDLKLDYKNNIREAFIFCCFTGLRYSDVQKLTWGEIKAGPDGTLRIETKMKKTKQDIFIPLSANACKWLPERGKAEDDAKVFPGLPQASSETSFMMRHLEKKTGLNKHLSFHVSRHTFATLTLNYGADLYTVSKLLGHASVQTTQIYAKIVDESKRKAVNLIPEM